MDEAPLTLSWVLANVEVTDARMVMLHEVDHEQEFTPLSSLGGIINKSQ